MRKAVIRYEGCLADLPARQRRVLRLRAGIGPRPPASRIAVARRLDLEVGQVRRAERRGVRALRRAGREGCAVAPDGDPTATVFPTAAGDGGMTLLATGGGEFSEEVVAGGVVGADGPGGSGTDGEGDGSESDASGIGGGGTGGVKGATAVRPAPGAGASDLTLPLLLVILGAFAAVGVWRLWRSRAAADAEGDAAALD